MTNIEILRSLEELGHWERLEDLSARWKLPHVPEYELSYFHKLYYPELRAVLESLDGAAESGEAPILAARGRARRILGDMGGAAADLQQALDIDASHAPAQAWLGEMAMGTPQGQQSLSRALESQPDLDWALLYRGAGALLTGSRETARRDLERFTTLRPESALGWLLLGAASAGRSARERAFEQAAKCNPVCSAAYLLRAREAAKPAQAARLMHEAYNVSPVLGFITLQIHQTLKVDATPYVRKILGFVFTHPETVGAYYQREATQTHYSHFPAEDYSFVEALVGERPDLAWAHAFFGRAACYTPAGALEGDSRLSRAIELAPHAGWFYAWRANARGLQGRVDEALADFSTSIRLQPFYHRVFVWRGGLLRKLGRHAEALADLDRAVRMDPFYSLTFHERSLVRRALGDLVGAALDLDRAFLLDPRYRWIFKTGRAPTEAELDAGQEQLDRAVAAHPSLPSLRMWRGQLQLQRRAYSAAFQDFERAVSMDPHSALALAWYGRGLSEAGEQRRAAEFLARALELEPRLWIAYGWLADAEFRAGRRRQAYASLRRVLREKPKTAWAYSQRGSFRLEEGRARAALPDFKRALLLDGKYPEAYLSLAQAHLRLGELKLARLAVEKCLEIAPNMGKAYLLRAAVSAQAGKPEQVIADYRRVRQDFSYLFNAEERERVDRILAGTASESQSD